MPGPGDSPKDIRDIIVGKIVDRVPVARDVVEQIEKAAKSIRWIAIQPLRNSSELFATEVLRANRFATNPPNRYGPVTNLAQPIKTRHNEGTAASNVLANDQVVAVGRRQGALQVPSNKAEPSRSLATVCWDRRYGGPV